MIHYYRHLDLWGDGGAAANACLRADPPRPPGSSEEFRAAAARLGRIAQALRDALARLEAVRRNEELWRGDGADAFKNFLQDPVRTHLDQVPDRYDGYAHALVTYASTLDDHQARIDGARADVQSALDAYQRAAAQAAAPCKTAYSTTTLPCLLPPDGVAARHAAAIDECLGAARQFQAAYNEWIDSALTCQHAIKTVDGDKLHNPHGGHVVVDAIAGLADELSNLTAVLAVVALPLAPEVSLLLLTLSSAFSAVKLGADIDRKVQYGEDVSWRTYALDALGSIPAGKALEGAADAGKAAKSAGLLGKLGKGAKGFPKGFGHELVGTYWHGPPAAARALKNAGFRGAFGKPTARRAWNNLGKWDKQDVLGYPASWGDDAWSNAKNGWVNAVKSSAFRVTWQPFGPLVPDGLERGVARAASTIGAAARPSASGGRP